MPSHKSKLDNNSSYLISKSFSSIANNWRYYASFCFLITLPHLIAAAAIIHHSKGYYAMRDYYIYYNRDFSHNAQIIAVCFSLLFFALSQAIIPQLINTPKDKQNPSPSQLLQNIPRILATIITPYILILIPFTFLFTLLIYINNYNQIINLLLIISLFISLFIGIILFFKSRLAPSLSAIEKSLPIKSLKNSNKLSKGKFHNLFTFIGFYLFLTCTTLITLYILQETYKNHPILFHLALTLPLIYALILTTQYSTTTHHYRTQKPNNQENTLKIFD